MTRQPMSDTASDNVRLPLSCEDVEPAEVVMICAWHEKDRAVAPGQIASHGICSRCRVEHFVLPRLQGVIAKLAGDGYLGTTLRGDLVADLRRVERFLCGAARRRGEAADETNGSGA